MEIRRRGWNSKIPNYLFTRLTFWNLQFHSCNISNNLTNLYLKSLLLKTTPALFWYSQIVHAQRLSFIYQRNRGKSEILTALRNKFPQLNHNPTGGGRKRRRRITLFTWKENRFQRHRVRREEIYANPSVLQRDEGEERALVGFILRPIDVKIVKIYHGSPARPVPRVGPAKTKLRIRATIKETREAGRGEIYRDIVGCKQRLNVLQFERIEEGFILIRIRHFCFSIWFFLRDSQFPFFFFFLIFQELYTYCKGKIEIQFPEIFA